MLAYVLIACLVIPLLLLLVDVITPRAKKSDLQRQPPLRAQLQPQAEIRPHVTGPAGARRSAQANVVAATARPPRIAPGDGMVYRGSARPR